MAEHKKPVRRKPHGFFVVHILHGSRIMDTDHKRGFTTAVLHSDRDAPIEHGALHKPLHLSVAYGYRDARELAAVFQGRATGYAYGKFMTAKLAMR